MSAQATEATEELSREMGVFQELHNLDKKILSKFEKFKRDKDPAKFDEIKELLIEFVDFKKEHQEIFDVDDSSLAKRIKKDYLYLSKYMLEISHEISAFAENLRQLSDRNIFATFQRLHAAGLVL